MSEIPEDLNDLYAWAILPKDVGELFPGFIRKRVKTLIERIGKLVQERDALKVQLGRLSAPVKTRNLLDHYFIGGSDPRGCNYPIAHTICGYGEDEHPARAAEQTKGSE